MHPPSHRVVTGVSPRGGALSAVGPVTICFLLEAGGRECGDEVTCHALWPRGTTRPSARLPVGRTKSPRHASWQRGVGHVVPGWAAATLQQQVFTYCEWKNRFGGTAGILP